MVAAGLAGGERRIAAGVLPRGEGSSGRRHVGKGLQQGATATLTHGAGLGTLKLADGSLTDTDRVSGLRLGVAEKNTGVGMTWKLGFALCVAPPHPSEYAVPCTASGVWWVFAVVLTRTWRKDGTAARRAHVLIGDGRFRCSRSPASRLGNATGSGDCSRR